MTSWKRGKQNENKGDRMMDSPEVGDKLKGAALKAAGMAEQGIDNVKDRVTGEQKDLQGKERAHESHTGTRKGSHSHQAKAGAASHEKKSGGSSASRSRSK